MRKLLFTCFFIAISSYTFATKYMHVSVIYKGWNTRVFVIEENGQKSELKLPSIGTGFGISHEKISDIQITIQSKLNELARDGWKVNNVSNVNNQSFIVVNYLLEKED